MLHEEMKLHAMLKSCNGLPITVCLRLFGADNGADHRQDFTASGVQELQHADLHTGALHPP